MLRTAVGRGGRQTTLPWGGSVASGRSAPEAGRAGPPNQPKTDREILIDMILHELGPEEKELVPHVMEQLRLESGYPVENLVLRMREQLEDLVALVKAVIPTVRENAKRAAVHKGDQEAVLAVKAAAERVRRDKASASRFLQELEHPELHLTAPQGKKQPVTGALKVADLLNKGIKAALVLLLNELGVAVNS
jgi:hypothetical protein